MFPSGPKGHRASVSGALALAAVASCLAGCGSSRNLPAEQLPRAAGGTVARVGSQKIDQAAYDHLFAVEAELAEMPVPVPPDFERCVKHLYAVARQIGAKRPPRSALRLKCRERYEELRTKTLDRLLVGAWVIGVAKELGITVSDEQVQAKLARARRVRFPDGAEYKRWLARTGMTQRELEDEVKAELLTEPIRRAVLERLGPLTRSKVKAYYEAHPQIGSVPGSWDLEIVSAASLREAAQMRREISSGRSFAAVSAGLVYQPVGSKHGHDVDYGAAGHYAEPVLDKAITTAKPKTLEGPLKIMFGPTPRWFVFRVVKAKPQFQKAFREVESGLGKTLPSRIRQEALDAFSSSWAAKWKARTSCAANYQVSLCERAKGNPTQDSLGIPGVFH